jgi:hypothetical protein
VSLAETQQIYNLLLEIDALLKNVEIKTKQLNSEFPQTQKSVMTFREMEYIAFRVTSLLNRMGLPPVYDRLISHLQKLILMIRIAHSSLMLLEAKLTPFGAIKAAFGFASLGLTIYDSMQGY